MKKLEVMIKLHRLAEVKAALCAEGITGLTAEEVRRHEPGISETTYYRGGEVHTDLLPRIKLEIITYDDLVDRLVRAILRGVAPGGIDDGQILVGEVLQAVRIRTDEIDEAAIG